jgi:RNA polymerase sigma-70 factor (ECF subfamily)
MASPGGRARFDRLVRPVLGDLFRFARRLAGDDAAAEDLLQAALERGLAHVDQLADDRAFKVWQSRVLYRTFLNDRVRRKDVPTEPEALEGAVLKFQRGPATPDERLAQTEIGRAVKHALDALPADQREAVWLVDGQGFSYAEAADVLGVPVGTTASRVARGRMALRGALQAVAVEQGVAR